MTLAHTNIRRPFGWDPTQQFVVAVAMTATIAAGWTVSQTSFQVLWTVPVALVVLFAAAEVFVVHLEYRRNAHTFSLVELPLVIGLVAAPPAVLIAAHVIGAAAALVLHRRQRPIKLMFNLSAFALQDVVAILVFRAFDSTDIGDSRTWAALLVACLASSLLSLVLVQTVMWVNGDHPGRRDVLMVAGLGSTFTCITAAAAVAAVVLWEHDRLVTLVIVPALVRIFLAQRIQVTSIVRRQRLAAIDASLADATEARSSDELVDDLLARVRDASGAREASLVRMTDDEATVRSCRYGATAPMTTIDTVDAWTWLLETHDRDLGREGRLVPVGPRAARHRGVTTSLDRMSAAVQIDDRTSAFLVVRDKLSDVGRFGRDDLDFLQLMARQLEVAIAPRVRPPVDEMRLLELELNHRVRRDALTGLPNELALIERLGQVVGTDAAPSQAVVAISFAVVDGATVDTDDLALVVSQRLSGSLRSRDTLTRWAPDVFVALVALTDGIDEVRAVALRLRDRLSTAVSVAGDEHLLDVRIGACRADITTDAATLVGTTVVASSEATALRPIVIVSP